MEDPHEVGAARHEGPAQVQDRLAPKNQKHAIRIDEVAHRLGNGHAVNGMNARGGIRAKARIQQPLEDEADDEREEGADEPEDDEAGSEDDVVSP